MDNKEALRARSFSLNPSGWGSKSNCKTRRGGKTLQEGVNSSFADFKKKESLRNIDCDKKKAIMEIEKFQQEDGIIGRTRSGYEKLSKGKKGGTESAQRTPPRKTREIKNNSYRNN